MVEKWFEREIKMQKKRMNEKESLGGKKHSDASFVKYRNFYKDDVT